jgi:hypothetical protein
MVKSPFSHGFPMVFPWFSHGFPMVSMAFPPILGALDHREPHGAQSEDGHRAAALHVQRVPGSAQTGPKFDTTASSYKLVYKPQ